MSVTQEILDYRFYNWADSTSRHTTFVHSTAISDRAIAGFGSAYFNGLSYLQVMDNDLDW